ncbi:MAG: adenosylmethionine--8-amino-7-oxononanoate transaminase [Polyangia bacterium]
MDTEALTAIDKRHLWHPFTPMRVWLDEQPLIIAAAEGNELIDTDGRRYLDGVSSLWCNVHGHRHPAIDAAIRAQLDRVAHSTLLGLASVPSIELAGKLAFVAPPGLTKVFYSDSGSTAVEIALKIAFQAHQLRGTKRTKFLVLDNAYHGDTIGSVSLGGIDLFHQIFQPLLFNTVRLQPTIEALEAAFSEHGADAAALVVEPLIQGAAGMLVQPVGFLARARSLCDTHGVLLICDEVATGFGRTGTLFACEQEGVTPDLMCVAKGISGGYLPLAATLATDALFDTFLGAPAERLTFFHGHTYTGNPLACAAALASLALFEDGSLMNRVRSNAAHLGNRLEKLGTLPRVREIRRRGLMVGIELHPAEGRRLGLEVCRAVRDKGVILRPLGDVIVLMPPLSFGPVELDRLVEVVHEAIDEVCP